MLCASPKRLSDISPWRGQLLHLPPIVITHWRILLSLQWTVAINWKILVSESGPLNPLDKYNCKKAQGLIGCQEAGRCYKSKWWIILAEEMNKPWENCVGNEKNNTEAYSFANRGIIIAIKAKKVCRHAKTLLIVNVSTFFHAVSTNVPLTCHIVGAFFTGGSLFTFALSFLLCQEINIWLTEEHKCHSS